MLPNPRCNPLDAVYDTHGKSWASFIRKRTKQQSMEKDINKTVIYRYKHVTCSCINVTYIKQTIKLDSFTCKISFCNSSDAILLHLKLFQILEQRECFLWHRCQVVTAKIQPFQLSKRKTMVYFSPFVYFLLYLGLLGS